MGQRSLTDVIDITGREAEGVHFVRSIPRAMFIPPGIARDASSDHDRKRGSPSRSRQDTFRQRNDSV